MAPNSCGTAPAKSNCTRSAHCVLCPNGKESIFGAECTKCGGKSKSDEATRRLKSLPNGSKVQPLAGHPLHCNIRREGGHSLVNLEGKGGIPL